MPGCRALLVSFISDGEATGMGRWTRRVAAELEARGWTVALWFRERFPRAARLGRTAVLLHPLALAADLLRARRDFDVVVAHEPSSLWYAALRHAPGRLPPLVVMSHGVESHMYRLRLEAAARGLAKVPGSTRLKAPLVRLWQTDGALRLADAVVCLSSADADYLERSLRVPPRRIFRMTNGVGPEFLAARRAPDGGQRVLFVGGWLDNKGRGLLPELWRRVARAVPAARLTIAGTGFPEPTVRADLPPELQQAVTVLPRVEPLQGMIDLYTSHDAFLMPSVSEGSPLSLLEAMATGLPPVAARTCGIPDIVTHETDGLLFEPLDIQGGARETIRLLGDPPLRRRLGDAARARAAQLTWARAVEPLERAMEHAMEVGRG
ncbi:MAG TPA: glycosyltransferase family 4 protein [Myxococcales bacterium]|nr:glycosyltransferase family 4 protein [Myxococcales bacterium]